MDLKGLREEVQSRISKKLRRAENAYVKAYTQKATSNCRHQGSALGGRLFVCKIQCCGVDQVQAGHCFDEKARGCPDFTLRKSPAALRAEFKAIPKEELGLRWPVLAELFWMEEKLQTLLVVEEETEKKVG